MSKLGRNDLCHCGSGKKYKKCHLDADERNRLAIHPPQPGDQSPSAFQTAENLPNLFRQYSSHGSARERKEARKLRSAIEPILEYLEHRREIAAASAELEAHLSDFEKLASDEDRYLALAKTVFAEECFAPLRFTAADVQRAFEHVGYPATMSPDERIIEILRAAILHVAAKDCRRRLALRLFLMLPDFVAAGRHLEAWLIQCSAVDTFEDDESNPFLFAMFSYGYDAWAAAEQARNEKLFEKLGSDVSALRRMSAEEFDSWLQSQMADPVKTRVLKSFFKENPRLRKEAIANCEALERNSNRILDRQDSLFLQLPHEEVQPWLRLFEQRANQLGCFSETYGGAASKDTEQKIIEELALPLLREMAESIFTHDRILQLIDHLTKYRRERFDAGDVTTAAHAQSAITYLAEEDSPGLNSFLVSLCWRSLHSAIERSLDAVSAK